MLLSEQLLGQVKDQTWTEANSGWIWADTPENSEHKTFFFFGKKQGPVPTKNHTNTAAAYKGVPSSLGTWGSQRVTSVHTARAQKRDLEGENTVLRLQQSPQHAWGGEHRNPAYWPASLYQPSLVPQKRKGEHEMKAVPFPDSHKFNFPRTRLMLAPCIICTQSH